LYKGGRVTMQKQLKLLLDKYDQEIIIGKAVPTMDGLTSEKDFEIYFKNNSEEEDCMILTIKDLSELADLFKKLSEGGI
jgi:hypothetical protein